MSSSLHVYKKRTSKSTHLRISPQVINECRRACEAPNDNVVSAGDATNDPKRLTDLLSVSSMDLNLTKLDQSCYFTCKCCFFYVSSWLIPAKCLV